MAETGTSPGTDGENRAMLEIATPDLYRMNAFRVLGLPVDASSSDLAKRQTMLKMLGKLGADASVPHHGILPLNPPADADALRQAGHRLRDPESRIVDELFWFWPVDLQNSDGDGGLSLLRRGDLLSEVCQYPHWDTSYGFVNN